MKIFCINKEPLDDFENEDLTVDLTKKIKNLKFKKNLKLKKNDKLRKNREFFN
jgi:hypothetical protein